MNDSRPLIVVVKESTSGSDIERAWLTVGSSLFKSIVTVAFYDPSNIGALFGVPQILRFMIKSVSSELHIPLL